MCLPIAPGDVVCNVDRLRIWRSRRKGAKDLVVPHHQLYPGYVTLCV